MCSLYNELLRAGWTMDAIDRADLLGYLQLRAWALNREKAPPKRRFIDEAWPGARSK